jgi:hypothetical protein
VQLLLTVLEKVAEDSPDEKDDRVVANLKAAVDELLMADEPLQPEIKNPT